MVLDLKKEDGSAHIKEECAGEEERSTVGAEKGPWWLCLVK